ncbi:hypothetical protein SNE40_004427 [Patella caerulea]|uniref:Uncharacterized protein n=1 Tax=Patella caerulea TaxID=87958 RepID=A0AAN8K9B3_PATCE
MSFLLLWIICDFLGGQLITAVDVKCPKPAENCLTGTYNLHVIPGLGCIGCQEGCKPGFMQTSNQKYYNNSPVLTGSKDYNGIQIQASVNIEEPEWICTPGDKCLPGYFQGGSPSSSNHCAWCGEGCSRCTNYDMCDSCFGGYRRVSTPTILGTVRSTCQHSNVLCPVQPPNCTYDVYAVSGAGCLGCQLCSPGFTVTFNPSYFSTKSSASSSYDYRGLQIRSTVDINEPRYTCVAGKACSDGFYSRAAGDLTVCEWCGDGCVSCTDRNACKTCKKGYILSKTNGTCQTTNPIG